MKYLSAPKIIIEEMCLLHQTVSPYHKLEIFLQFGNHGEELIYEGKSKSSRPSQCETRDKELLSGELVLPPHCEYDKAFLV